MKEGDAFIFTTDEVEGDETRVSVTYKRLIEDLSVGDRILVNNGLVVFEVTALEGSNAHCRVLSGGVFSDRKSMNFPNRLMTGPFLSEQDKADLLFGIQNDVDFVAASFVSTRQDVEDMRSFLRENGGEKIDIIAKIENRAGVDNIEDICQACDGVMVARGDLGVEIPFVEVPAIQKFLINKCRMVGKRVITATEMLESMIQNPRPTRAEISDVANAVYDGSSAVMLSGETAAGLHPVEAVRNMAEIAEFTEQHISYARRFRNADFQIKNTLDAISHATCAMAMDVNARCIVVCSITGITARMVSRFRCPSPIIGMTTDPKVYRKLALSWAVTPVLVEQYPSMEVLFYQASCVAKQYMDLQKGDNIVITGGRVTGQPGNTNFIKVETI